MPDTPREAYIWLLRQDAVSDATVATLRQTVDAHPGDALWHVMLGAALIASDQVLLARPTLDDALRLDPTCALALAFMGDVSLHDEDPKAAEARYLESVGRAGKESLDVAVACHRLGAARLWRGDRKGAREAVEQGLAAARKSAPELQAQLLFDKAAVDDADGDSAAAIRALEESRAARPGRDATLRLAGYLMLSGYPDKAEPLIREAAGQTAPSSPAAAPASPNASPTPDALQTSRDEARAYALATFHGKCSLRQMARVWKILP